MIKPLDYQGPEYVNFEELAEDILNENVFQRFLSVVAKHGDRVALADAYEALTYKALYERVMCIATFLSSKTYQPKQHAAESLKTLPIALFLPHTINAPMAMLACLAVGIPYVPLDTAFPINRNRNIVKHSMTQLIITDAASLRLCQDLVPATCHIVTIEALLASELNSIVEPDVKASSIAYILSIPPEVLGSQKGFIKTKAVYCTMLCSMLIRYILI